MSVQFPPVREAWEPLRRPQLDPWTARLWPAGPENAPRPVVLGAALAVGALAALTLRLDVVGSAYLVSGFCVLAVAFGSRGRRPTAAEVAPAGLALSLLGVGALRDALWLVGGCLLGAWALGTLALVGARTWTGVAVAALASGLAPARAARWARAALVRARVPGLTSPRGWAVVAVTAAVLGLFGALFAAADPAYADLLQRAFPAADAPELVRRSVVLALVASTAVLAAYLAQRPPVTDVLAPAPGRPVRPGEWAVPLVLLDLLFGTFVLVQLTVLFGGRAHVLATEGLTYAEYARQGFWQLLVVTVLTLGVVAVAVRTGPRATAGERTIARVLLGLLCLLALVIVASAIHRMSLYEQAYGFTRLRVLVTAAELGLGGVFVLLLAAGVRLEGAWLPRAVVALAAVVVLGLAALDPDAYIARQNVTRYQETGRIDVAYLALLSADAVPGLLRLPADVRACALSRLAPELRASHDPWYDVNLARSRARRLLAAEPVGRCAG